MAMQSTQNGGNVPEGDRLICLNAVQVANTGESISEGDKLIRRIHRCPSYRNENMNQRSEAGTWKKTYMLRQHSFFVASLKDGVVGGQTVDYKDLYSLTASD